MLEGWFGEIDAEIVKKLEELGARVQRGMLPPDQVIALKPDDPYWIIYFTHSRPDQKEIEAVWQKLVAVFPDRHRRQPNTSGSANDFVEQYAPERPDILLAQIEERLALTEIDPDYLPVIQDKARQLRVQIEQQTPNN